MTVSLLFDNTKNFLINSVQNTMSLLMIVFILFLSGCYYGHAETKTDYKRLSTETNEALKAVEPKRVIRSALVIDDKPWFGHQAVRMRNGDPLPSDFTQNNSVVITFERALSLSDLARQVQVSTGLRVVVSDGESSGGEGAGGTTFLPFDGVEVTGGRVLWQGSLVDLLNQAADRFDVEWSFVDGVVRLTSFVTRTFMLHALAGETTTSGSVETGSTSEAGNLPTQQVDTTVTLSLWAEVEQAIANIISSTGTATFSPATGTITVSGTPTGVRRVEEYLRYQNRMRLRRVAVTMRVLSLQQEQENNLGFDLEAVFDKGLTGQPFTFDSGVSGTTTGIVRSVPSGLTDPAVDGDSVQAVIDALARETKVSIVHTGTVVTLSDQPAPLQVARQISYVARVSAAATSDSSSTSLEPGTVEEGLTMNVLPRVIEEDRVLLRLGVGITQVREIVDFVAGDLTVQLPDLDTTGFLQNIVLSGGEVLVMSGFERDDATLQKAGVGKPSNIVLGGENDVSRNRTVSVLVITADILPEDPFGVVGH